MILIGFQNQFTSTVNITVTVMSIAVCEYYFEELLFVRPPSALKIRRYDWPHFYPHFIAIEATHSFVIKVWY